MPPARSLYGTLPEQLENPSSFASRLRAIIDVRRRFDIATAVQVDVPDVSHRSELVMVHRLADGSQQITVLNFGAAPVHGTIRSTHLQPGAAVTDLFTGDAVGTVDDLHSFGLELGAYHGTALLVRPA